MTAPARSPWRRVAVLATVLALLGGGLWYALRPSPIPYDHASHLPEHIAQPPWMATTTAAVHEAYTFAAHNHDLLSQIPCWCGCGAIHNNNAECYFKRDAKLNITAYDDHAYGWGICVDITRAVIKDLNRGKPLAQIRQEIDAKYESQGLKPTPTPPIATQ